MELTDELSITLTVAEWLQVRAILAEQAAAFEAQVARNNATIGKINKHIEPVGPMNGPAT